MHLVCFCVHLADSYTNNALQCSGCDCCMILLGARFILDL